MELNFWATQCPLEYRRDVAVFHLEKDAEDWWRSLEDKVEISYHAELSWVQFCNEFMRKYIPQEARERLIAQYQSLTQQGRSVREYEAEFSRLRRITRYEASSDNSAVQSFVKGLRRELRVRLERVPVTDLPTLVRVAENVEQTLAAEQMEMAQQGMRRLRTLEQARKRTHDRPVGRTDNLVPKCQRCGEEGHRIGACVADMSHTIIQCTTCGEWGHHFGICPRGQSSRPPQPPERRNCP